MVQGIEIDDKNLKKKKRTLKEDAKDLWDIRDTVENYIKSVSPKTDEEIDNLSNKKSRKSMTFDRILVSIFLIFGIISLIAGLYLLYIGNMIIGIPATAVGLLFFLGSILYEIYA